MKRVRPRAAGPCGAALDAIEVALEQVAAVNPTFLATEVKAEALRRAGVCESRLAELRLRILADAQDVAMAGAARDVAAWLVHHVHLNPTSAKADVTLATALDRDRPQVAAGTASVDGPVSAVPVADQVRTAAAIRARVRRSRRTP